MTRRRASACKSNSNQVRGGTIKKDGTKSKMGIVVLQGIIYLGLKAFLHL